jgi:uncharacterized protein YbbK (DUF523 family)
MKKVKLCSACLLGLCTRYDGKVKRTYPKVLELAKSEILIPVCPEQLGGMKTPRADAYPNEKGEILGSDGEDVTGYFVKGAEEVLKIAKIYNIKEAILKQRSPSCGSGELVLSDKTIIKGDGITAALLKQNGIKVISDEEL